MDGIMSLQNNGGIRVPDKRHIYINTQIKILKIDLIDISICIQKCKQNVQYINHSQLLTYSLPRVSGLLERHMIDVT